MTTNTVGVAEDIEGELNQCLCCGRNFIYASDLCESCKQYVHQREVEAVNGLFGDISHWRGDKQRLALTRDDMYRAVEAFTTQHNKPGGN